MISIFEALNHIADLSHAPLGREHVFLGQAVQRVLAEPIHATRDWPSFDHSAMDGYAVKIADARPARSLRVVGEMAAGTSKQLAIQTGEAVRIFTGAPLPEGAETVVMQEATDRGAKTVTLDKLKAAHSAAQNIRWRGSDLTAGEAVLSPGAVLEAGEIAVLAAFSRAGVQVYRRPKVAILSVGTELKYPYESLGRGEIVNSNAPMLAALCQGLGAESVCLATIPDRKADLHRCFEQCQSFDLVLTSGGVSVGDHDLIQPVLNERGWQRSFWKVALKPGKPVLSGRLPRGPVFMGLPGNPGSALATFDLFVRPLLRRWLMHPRPYMKHQLATLASGFQKKAGRAQLLRGRIVDNQVFHGHAEQGSGHIGSLCHVEAYALLSPERTEYAAGEQVLIFDRLHDGARDFPKDAPYQSNADPSNPRSPES